MKTLQLAICALAFAFTSPAFCNADIFAIYDFDDGAPGGFTESVFPTPPLTVTPSAYNTRSSATQNSSPNTPFGGVVTPLAGDNHAYIRTNQTPDLNEFNSNDPLNPGSNNAYHEFSITTPSGPGTYALDSLHFEYWISDAQAGSTYSATIYSDLVGYGNSGFLLGTLQAETDPFQSRTRTIDLRGVTRADFNNIAGGQTVEFRILFSDNSTSTTDTDHHRIDDVTVRGRVTSAVPEPAAATLMLLAGGVLVVRRRRN
jgi:hypothetical protein